MTWSRYGIGFASKLAPTRTGLLAARLFCTPRRRPPKGWEHEAERRGERFNLNSTTSGLRWGSGRRRALLMHGWEGRATQFAALVEPLVDEDFEVYALDAPGHGRSSGAYAHPFLFARSMLELQGMLGSFDLAVGHSMGGGALLWAANHGLSVRSIVTMGAPTRLEDVLTRFCAYVNMGPDATRTFIDAMERETGVRPSDVTPERVGAGLGSRPGLIVHADDDREVPFSDAVELQEHWPGGSLREAPGLGHRRIMRDEDVVRDVVTFARATC